MKTPPLQVQLIRHDIMSLPVSEDDRSSPSPSHVQTQPPNATQSQQSSENTNPEGACSSLIQTSSNGNKSTQSGQCIDSSLSSTSTTISLSSDSERHSINISNVSSTSQSLNETPSSGTTSQSQSTPGSGNSEATTVSLQSEGDKMESDFLSNAWGLLTAVNCEAFRNVKLTAERMRFGRDPKCDYKFAHGIKTISGEKLYDHLSIVHFEIYKCTDEQSPYGFTPFILDRSKNGTYLNGEKIGKGNTRPLTNCDRISLTQGRHDSFIFVDIKFQEMMLKSLPLDFRRKYVLESVKLGTGTFGVVQRGLSKTSNDRVAVKIVGKTPSLCMAMDISYEAKLILPLKNANIVEIMDYYETNRNVYIVMEYMDGGELFTFIKTYGPIAEHTSKVWFLQLLEAVDFLHSKNIVHRDIKPENVLLSSKNVQQCRVKIADFGLSRIVSEKSLLQTQVGTPFFVAPEIILGHGYNKSVDLWSLGCILYIMLCGNLPFSDTLGKDILRTNILAGKFSFSTDTCLNISDLAKKLVRGLLTVDLQRRIPLQMALTHQWFLRMDDPPSKKRKIQ